MATFKPSVFQQAVYDHITLGAGNAVVDAVAGSGKSTTIVNALKLIPRSQSVLFLAFNKSIVEELKMKITDPNVEVRTLHSLGASVVSKAFRSQVNADKYRQYINTGLKFKHFGPSDKMQDEDEADYRSNIFKLIDLGRNNLITSASELDDIAFKFDLNIVDNECQVAMDAIAWGEKEISSIDFTDMIYFPNVKSLRVPQYDWVFIDECQDLNAAQRELFLKALKPTGRFVAVGDPQQAIYGFSGADVESFRILKNLPGTITLPLSVCYRCGTEIIKLAQTIVPHIQAKENACTGLINHAAALSEVLDGDMILCRTTAPLVEQCMKYIAGGTKAYVKGKDIGTNLINMIKKTKKSLIADAEKCFGIELKRIEAKVMSRLSCNAAEAKQSSLYTTYEDKMEVIDLLAEGLRTSDQVISRIEAIFKDGEKNGICLSTVHKAKGLEADRVFILRKDKFYLKGCMSIDWMAEQESNLVYIAYTRAKQYLGFIPVPAKKNF